jgi:hypothetical protein
MLVANSLNSAKNLQPHCAISWFTFAYRSGFLWYRNTFEFRNYWIVYREQWQFLGFIFDNSSFLMTMTAWPHTVKCWEISINLFLNKKYFFKILNEYTNCNYSVYSHPFIHNNVRQWNGGEWDEKSSMKIHPLFGVLSNYL